MVMNLNMAHRCWDAPLSHPIKNNTPNIRITLAAKCRLLLR